MVAKAAQAGGAAVQGIIPAFLQAWSRRSRAEEKLIVTPHIQERKALMLQMSDAFVVLPGGLGTFDEFFEVATEAQLGVHDKPIIVVNVDGYFDALDAMLHAIVETRLRQATRSSSSIIWPTAPEAALKILEDALAHPRTDLNLRSVAIELVDDRIGQRLERGIDDIRRHAHRGPAIALAVGAFHHDAGHRLGAAGEDAHLVIHQPQIGEERRNICPDPCAAPRPAH